jgi:glycolate oxidase FAD binding subunit
LPADAIATLMSIKELCAQQGATLSVRFHASSGLGMLSLAAADETLFTLISKLRSQCEAAGGYLTILEAPIALKEKVEVWGVPEGPTLAAMRQLKQQFDPNATLNPGRFVGGI